MTGSIPRSRPIHLGPSLLTPNRNYDVPGIKTTEYKDWTPKVAAAYDLFGNGRTALKVNYGKYVLGQALGGLATQGAYNVQLTSTRNWVDNDRDFVPDCDLTRNTTQGPTQAGIDNQVDTCNAAVGVNANFYDKRCGRPRPCRTRLATAGASGRTAGRWRSRRSTS